MPRCYAILVFGAPSCPPPACRDTPPAVCLPPPLPCLRRLSRLSGSSHTHRHCHSIQVCHCPGASRLKVLQSWNLLLNSCLLAPYLGSIVLGPASSMRPWLVVHTALKMPRYTIHSTMVAVPMAAATIWWCADRTVLLPLDSRGGCCRRCH